MREGLAWAIRYAKYHLRQVLNLRKRPLNSVSQEEIERWITPPRFRTFLIAASGDHGQATALYDWNVCISAVFFEVLSYTEVLLRNAVDAQFSPVRHDEPASQSWLLDAEILNEKSREKVTDAITLIRQEGKEPTRARVVAKLSFGFWRALFNKRYKDLWITHLHRAFPGGRGDRSEVATLLAQLNPFRNRLAHHEPIINASIDRRHEEMLDLIELMDAEARIWIESRSCVPEVLAWRPPLDARKRFLARVGMTPRTTRFHLHR